MTPRDLLKATLIVGLVYVLRKIDHFNATLDTMTRESEAEIARSRARIEELKAAASAAPSTSTSTTPSAGKPDAH